MRDKGEWYVSAGKISEDFDTFQAERLDLYAEYGLTKRLTVSAKYERQDFEDSDVFDSEGFRIALRRSFDGPDWLAVSGELALISGEAIGGARGCGKPGIGGLVSIGTSRKVGNTNLYASAAAGARLHSSGCDRLRSELTFGADRPSGTGVRVQLWSERGGDFPSDKLQILFHRDLFGVTVSTGVREEIGGAFNETATVIALSGTFGGSA